MTNTERFKQIVSEMADTYQKKNSDYGNSFETTLEKWGPKIALARLDDKLNRAASLIEHPAQIKDESIADTLLDLATYAIMFKMWLEKGTKPEAPAILEPVAVKHETKDIASALFIKYGGKEVPAMKGLNQSGYSPTQVLGDATIIAMDIRGNKLHVKYNGLHRGSKTVGSGTMDAYYPLDDLATYGFTA